MPSAASVCPDRSVGHAGVQLAVRGGGRQPVHGHGVRSSVPPGGLGLPGGLRHQQRQAVVLEYCRAGRQVLPRGFADRSEGDQLVLRYDEDMTDYVWNTKNYPACPAGASRPRSRKGRRRSRRNRSRRKRWRPRRLRSRFPRSPHSRSRRRRGFRRSRNDRPPKMFLLSFTKPAFAAYNKQSMKKRM